MTGPRSGGASSALEALCNTLGVQPGYQSAGVYHAASTESLVAALRALGAPLEGPGDAAEALRSVRAAELDRVLPATVVSWADEPPSVPVRLPAESTTEPLELQLLLEDGSLATRRVDPGEIRWREGGSGDLPLPSTLPPGYHEVRLLAGGREGQTRVVRAPRTTWSGSPGVHDPEGDAEGDAEGDTEGDAGRARRPTTRRRWATFLPLHALRTGREWGAGDLSDLRALSEWTADRGGSWVGLLPLYDTFLGDGPTYDPSPYAPVSRRFFNPLWIAPEEAPGLERAPEARALLEDDGIRRRARELREGGTVDYRAVMGLKRRVLEALAEAHRGEGPHGLGAPLVRWIREDPEALAYARFRAAVDATASPWSGWDGRARGGDDDALGAPDDLVRYYVYAQWAVQRQLEDLARRAPAGLYLDLPLGSHPDGFDHWRHPEHYARDFTVGAPPDAFFEGGQDWSFPPPHPRRAREDGHRYWAACLERTMAVADALRLDHVMGLHRLFWIPRGAGAADGVYVRYPAEELWAVLCLESHRHETEVVGEDLGTVPPEVPRAMERHGARRMWVLPFEVAADDESAASDDGGPPAPAAGYRLDPPGAHSVACLDTHDLPPFAAFLDGSDIDARLRDGLLDEEGARAEREGRAAWRAALVAWLRDRGALGPEEPADAATLLPAALELLASSDADILVVNLEDLWLETEPQNVPGTPSTGNWVRKARLSLEDMTADARVRTSLELVDRCR